MNIKSRLFFIALALMLIFIHASAKEYDANYWTGMGDKFYDNCGGINSLGEFYGMALNEPERQLLRQCASY